MNPYRTPAAPSLVKPRKLRPWRKWGRSVLEIVATIPWLILLPLVLLAEVLRELLED
jgi:hypothetical protein